MQTHRCLVEFIKETPESIRNVVNEVNKSLDEQHGNDYTFNLEVWWRQISIDYDIYSHPYPINNLEEVSNKIGLAFDGYENIKEFTEEFFSNQYWISIEELLNKKGWTKVGPEIIKL